MNNLSTKAEKTTIWFEEPSICCEEKEIKELSENIKNIRKDFGLKTDDKGGEYNGKEK